MQRAASLINTVVEDRFYVDVMSRKFVKGLRNLHQYMYLGFNLLSTIKDLSGT